MTVWHIQGRHKIPYGARRGVAMVCVSALLVFAIYPGTVEATMMNDDAPQAYRDSREPFLFSPALSRVGFNAEACSLASYQADASFLTKNSEQTSERAEYGAGMSNLVFPSTGRLFRDGDSRSGFEPSAESPGLDRMVWEPNGHSSDARLLNSIFRDVGRIETRMANILNCLNYMRYLLKTIGAIFSLPQGNLNTESDKNVVSNPYNFVFMAVGVSTANSSDSAKVDSKYIPKFKLRNTLTTIMNENRGKVTRNSSARTDVSISSSSRADASSSKRNTPQRAWSVKEMLKDLVVDIFSQVYTYVLMVAIFVFGLFLRNRV